MLYAALLRPLLFRLEPERAHHLGLLALRLAGRFPGIARVLVGVPNDPRLAVEAFGLRFANPLGLAAGFDKDAVAVRGLAALGFGHVEVGTVTSKPQPGNPRPRLFRLPEDEALVNRLGFPSAGAERFVRNLAAARPAGCVVGANLGKGKETPLERAVEDYRALVAAVAAHADYLVVNVSSPNTVGLRRLQAREFLDGLLAEVVAANRATATAGGFRPRPLLLKIAPDLSDAELDDGLAVALDRGLDGLIATNTTITRSDLRSRHQAEAGGLSGRPLRSLAVATVRAIRERTGGQLPIVGVGGVASAADVADLLQAGATLVQLYTSFIYGGPGHAARILRGLRTED